MCALGQQAHVVAQARAGCDQQAGGRRATEHAPRSTGRRSDRAIGTHITGHAEPVYTDHGGAGDGLSRDTADQTDLGAAAASQRLSSPTANTTRDALRIAYIFATYKKRDVGAVRCSDVLAGCQGDAGRARAERLIMDANHHVRAGVSGTARGTRTPGLRPATRITLRSEHAPQRTA